MQMFKGKFPHNNVDMRNYNKLFIDNIKSLMAEKHISQSYLASKISVDQTTISAWLRGESEPALTKICMLLEFFDCTFEDLLS